MLGDGVFADATSEVKMRAVWVRVGPESMGKHPHEMRGGTGGRGGWGWTDGQEAGSGRKGPLSLPADT